MQIIVLGMHRSGTSATARIINMMGASLGTEQVRRDPAPDNATGFCEHQGVRELNDGLLASLGGSWSSLPDLDLASLPDTVRKKFDVGAEKLIRDLDIRRPWVMKDPRLCLLLPLWRPFLPSAVCVLVHRAPTEIAQSLEARDGVPIPHSVALWERYTLSALESSADFPRLLVSYRRLIREPIATAKTLLSELRKSGVTGLRSPSRKAILSFVDADLCHHETSRELEEAYLNPCQNRLAMALQDGSALRAFSELAPSPKVQGILRAEAIHQRECAGLSTDLRGNVQRLNGAVEAQTATIKRLETSNGTKNDRAEDLRTRCSELEERIRTQQQEATETNLSLGQRLAENETLRNEAARFEAQLRELTLELRRADGALSERAARLEEYDRKAQTREAKLREEAVELEEARRTARELHTSLTAANANLSLAASAACARDENAKSLEQQLTLLSDWMEHIRYGFGVIMNSRRWRIGNTLVGVAGRFFGLPRVPPLVDHMHETMRNFREWRQSRRIHSPPALLLKSSPPARPAPAAPSDTDGSRYQPQATYDVIFLANIDWNARFQRPQQLATQFAQQGHRVFYVVASEVLPESSSPGYSAAAVAPDIYEVKLTGPRQVDRYSAVLDSEMTQAFVRSIDALRMQFHIVDAASLVHLPFWAPLAFKLRDRREWPVVYDCMDEWEGFPGIGAALLVAERDLVERSDLVTVTASLLHAKWKKSSRACELIRNGVDVDFFARTCRPNDLLAGVARPIIGYYGALADWVDLDLIRNLAARRPSWQFVLIGDKFVDDLCGLDEMNNVHLLGRKPYKEMPLYLYHFDVCIIPFRVNDVTHAVDPVKFYEFASTGKPIVAVPLEELQIYDEHLYFGSGCDGFLSRIEEALKERDPVRAAKRRELARDSTWKHRYEEMHSAVASTWGSVSIIIVTYGNVELTRLCVESVLQNTTHPNYEIIIVDNNSSDGTTSYLQYLDGQSDRVRVILNDENRGFAAANNQGLAIAQGDCLVLLNNDTVVPRGWLAPMLRHLRSTDIGMVGPVTNFVGNEAKIDVPYETIDGMSAFAARHVERHARKCFDIGMLAMFCLAMRRDVYEEVGPLDEEFKVGMFEDDDYSRRVKKKGYRIVCAEDAFVHHYGQAAFKKLLESGEYQAIWDANRAHFEKKWGHWEAHRPRTAATATENGT